ncbi:MAG: 3-isopropylmalate dehydrogenase [Trueperaceae bacterium]
MSNKIAVLPGDFIGPEVIDSALAVLDAVGQSHGLTLEYQRLPFGGGAIESHGEAFPQVTRDAVLQADAVLMGSVGGPVGDHPWNRLPREQRVETGILALRRHLQVYANLRPVKVFPGLERLSPLRSERAAGTDLIIFRELTGGIYFGKPSSVTEERGVSTMVYDRYEVERIARLAFETARQRSGRVTNVDKANVLDVSQFWRNVVVELHQSEFSDLELDHLYIDNAAMQVVRDPQAFDVLVMGNLFGDIMSDLAAVIPGSLGLLPSASLGGSVGLYEPVHGSAPDIAGKGIANPVGTILSAAMMLRHSLDQPAAAAAVENAVQVALAEGPTVDLGGARGTEEFTRAVVNELKSGSPTVSGVASAAG